MSTQNPGSSTPAPAPSEFKESQMTGTGPNTVMPGANDEKLSQHGKMAAIFAGVVGAALVGGLLWDGIFHTAPTIASTPTPKMDGGPAQQSDPFVDFEAKQKLEAARIEQERKQKMAKDRAFREAQAQEALEVPQPVAGGPMIAAAPAQPVRTPEQDLRETARLEDLKRALAAMHSSEMVIGGTKSSAEKGASVAPSSGSGTVGKVAASGTNSALSQLKQAIDRARDGGGSGGAGANFVRDLRPAEATAAVVGQSASARRAGGESARQGEFLVPVGTVVPAILDMEVSSDWEGRWRGMITRDIYDISQDYILIPKGTRILGTAAKIRPVNESINERMALAAQWLVLPNGARIDMSRSGVLDSGGVGAIGGDVNHHYMATAMGVVAYGVISGLGAAVAKKADENGGTNTSVSINGGSITAGGEIAKGFTDLGHRIADRYLNLVPTITLKPGTAMNIFLDDEMFMQAWAPIDEVYAPPTMPANSPMRASR